MSPHLFSRRFRRASKPVGRRKSPLAVELLEHRLAPAIGLTGGVPNWVEQGPWSLGGGQVEGIAGSPVAGAIRTVAPHPTNPNTLLVGSVNGGIWRTTNANADSPDWTPLIDDFPSLSITALAFSPFDSNTIFAGVGTSSSARDLPSAPLSGLLRTTDGGTTWRFVGPELRGRDIREVVPLAGGTTTGERPVLVATSSGLFRSPDNGLSFTRVRMGNFTDLAADPVNPFMVYAAQRNTISFPSLNDGAVLLTVNGGFTWAATGSSLMRAQASTAINIKLSVNPTAARSVFAGIVAGPGGELVGVHRSANLGVTWTAMDLPGTTESFVAEGFPPVLTAFVGIHPGRQGNQHFSLAADPTNPFVVYVGGDRQPFSVVPRSDGTVNFSGRLFRGDASRPLGSQWESITGLSASLSAPHADSRDIAFDRSGNLLQGDDGGIYRLRNPSAIPAAGPRRWESVNGDLRITELRTVAYDPVHQVILAGTQDNGSVEMIAPVGTPNPPWSLSPLFTIFGEPIPFVGDGGVQAVDASSPSGVIRYSLGNNFLSFSRRTFNAQGALVSAEPVFLAAPDFSAVPLSGLVGPDPTMGITGFPPIRYVLNSVQPSFMLLGFNGLYESFDQGRTIRPVQTAGMPPMPVTTPPVTALAYGGMHPNGAPNPSVAYVARGTGLSLRTTATGAFTPVPAVVGTILDIALDPSNFRTAYLLGGGNRVFRVDNAGLTDATTGMSLTTVTEITGNLTALGAVGLQTLEIFRSASGQRVLLVGGRDGVYRTRDSDTAPPAGPNSVAATWHEFGAGLPNAPVTDIRYDPSPAVGGRLIVSTLGRGAWTLDNADARLTAAAFLVVRGDAVPFQNDTIRLVRNAAKPWLLDVFLNNTSATPDFSVRLSTLERIDVSGGEGTDTLTVDSTNGPIAVPLGIRFGDPAAVGAVNIDRLVLTGGTATSDLLEFMAPGPIGFRSSITFNTDDDFDGTPLPVTQVVEARSTEVARAVNNLVAVGTPTVPGTLTVRSGVAGSFTLDNGAVTGDGQLRVTTPRGSVEFANKTNVVIDGTGQADTINLVNTESAAGLASLMVNALGGSDTINVAGTRVATTIEAGDQDDTINVGRALLSAAIVTLEDIDAPLTVRGGPGPDTLNVTSTPLLLPGLDPSVLNGVLTATTLSGLGMAGAGINHESFVFLNVFLGGGANRMEVQSTSVGNDGVRTETTINTGPGADTILVGNSNGTVDEIGGALTIDGGQGGGTPEPVDTLVINDDRGTTARFATLRDTTITSLAPGGPITYRNLETLTVVLGTLDDTFTIEGTHAGTTSVRDARGNSSNDTFRVRAISGPTTIEAGAGNDTVRVHSFGTVDPNPNVNAISRLLTVIGGANSRSPGDQLIVDDSGDDADRGPNVLAFDTAAGRGGVRGFGMAGGIDFEGFEGVELRDRGSVVTVGGFEGSGITPVVQAKGLIFEGTNRNDTIRVGWDFVPAEGHEGCTRDEVLAGFCPHRDIVVFDRNGQAMRVEYEVGGTITVRAGRGNDRVETGPAAGAHWRMELFGEQGNDHLTGGVRNDLLDGGIGNDVLEGGDGDDELVGDRGHDQLRGGRGNDLLSGGAGQDVLFGDEGDDVLIGGPGQDSFWGGPGADRILAADDDLDVIFADLADLLLEIDRRRDRVIRV